MNSKVQDYMDMFAKAKGNNLAKVKHILMKCSENWEWVGSGSIIADLLDDKNITAEDVVEFLRNSVEMEEGNREFKAAVTAMELSLKKTQKISATPMMDVTIVDDELEGIDYQAFAYYQNLAEAS